MLLLLSQLRPAVDLPDRNLFRSAAKINAQPTKAVALSHASRELWITHKPLGISLVTQAAKNT